MSQHPDVLESDDDKPQCYPMREALKRDIDRMIAAGTLIPSTEPLKIHVPRKRKTKEESA